MAVEFRDMVVERLRSQFARMRDLAESLPESALESRLPAPSSTVGAQMWCVVGARESYTRALAEGRWSGFSCSLDYARRHDKASVVAALTASSEAVDERLTRLHWSRQREDLLVELLEHEAQHQGQLIRYLYGLGLTIPTSWAERWALE